MCSNQHINAYKYAFWAYAQFERMNSVHFYENFIRLCTEMGVTPGNVMRDLNMSRNTPNNWKYGRAPSRATLLKLSSYFGVPEDYLMDGYPETFTNVANGNISGSSIVIGSKANEIISSAGGDNSLNLSEAEEELIRIFRKVGVRKQTQIMSFVFDLEEKE